MGAEIIALIAALLAVIPVIISAMNKRKAARDVLAEIESAELLASMDAADRAPKLRQPGKTVYVRRKPPVQRG